MDEHQAIYRLKQGDIRGLEWVVNQYHEKAIRIAYLIAGDSQLAEDIVQDAFLRVFRSIQQFDASRPFAPWFFRIVANQAVQASQKQARQLSMNDDEEKVDLVKLLSSTGPTVEELAEASELSARLWEVIQKLSPRQREVIVFRYYLGMNEKEMAGKLSSAPGTVKWLLNAARKKLSALLKPERMQP